jgi:serine/threonine-protein kinase
MSPEQIKNAKHVDARADIWSMGVILYKLLTNHKPFNGDTMGEVFAAIFEETPKPLRSFRPDIPPALEEIVIGRCLQRDREKRFRNVAELAIALAPFGLPTSRSYVERISRRLKSAGGGLSVSKMVGSSMATTAAMPTVSKPMGLGGATDQSASVSHISQVSQSQASQASSSQSYSQAGHAGYEPAGLPTSSNRTILFVIAGVLAFFVIGGIAFTAKMLLSSSSTPASSASGGGTASSTTTAPTTPKVEPTVTTTATATTSGSSISIDSLPTKPTATAPSTVMTGTTQTSVNPKSTGTTKASAGPADDVLKMRR